MNVAAPKIGEPPAVPTHVAIIMDGNGRWAAARNLPRIAGHRAGADSVRTAVKSATNLGVRYLTLYSFSSENWKRPIGEVQDLMGLLRRYLKSEIEELRQNGVRLRFIGNRNALSNDIQHLIDEAEAVTIGGTSLDLTIAISYGGRDEIVEAARALASNVEDGVIKPTDIDEAMFGSHLSTADVPDPDLLIRTSGEQRISNFLLWQLAYAEFLFLDVLWPDFSETHFAEAIGEFQRRERRYGATA